MAPALTEPISPTEKLTSTAATASATPATRSSSRKLDSINIKASNTKRNCNGSILKSNSSSSALLRSTRSKEIQQQRETLSSNPLSVTIISADQVNLKNSLVGKASVQQKCTTRSFTLKSSESIEQMGLNTAPADSKNKINTQNSSTTNYEDDDTVKGAKEDTSTAQLLADLTNEAITAEICLRNQLKDVNLVKVSEGNSSPLQQTNDIVVLKSIAAASNPTFVVETKKDTAHMEAQFHVLETKSSPIQVKLNTDNYSKSAESSQLVIEQKQLQEEESSENDVTKVADTKICNDNTLQDESPIVFSDPESVKNTNPEEIKAEVYMHAVSNQESPIDSPEFDRDEKSHVHGATKLETLDVPELPPVSTDSTMTASEVEDNLEERLSQLDGTAIDSPPPNEDMDGDTTIKASDVNSCTATPPRTPTHQQSLSQDLHSIQQQLQNTPPTPVSQQVQSNNMNQSCFTPQSTTSSVNTVGSGNIPQSFIKESEGGAADLEDQDIEEVFKVLKGFEGGTSSDLNVCDLNVLFNEVYMKMNETDMGSNSAVGNVNAVQIHSGIVNPSIQLVKPTELEEGHLDIEKRHQQMQRKIDFLMRRLRKQQSRYMCKHTSEEISGLFEWSSRQASKGVSHNTLTGVSNSDIGAVEDPSKYFLKVISARPPASDWKGVQESSVSATQISTLLRKIQTVANAQQLRITAATNLSTFAVPRKSKKALNDAHTSSSASSYIVGKSASKFGEGRAEDVIVSTLDENVTDELSQVAGLLQSEMCEVQRAIDSDATESSSGGESADEMVTYNNQQQQTLPITKRAAWRYSRDRAAIASRWSWLLSQIADLEIKIRQHSELHQEIVRTKGPVISQNENGLKRDLPKTEVNEKDEASGSCRTRGFLTTQFRKRKLIQTTNIHTISKKAARPSTIKCGCQWPLHPCAVCTGRSDPTAPRDLPDTMMMSDRMALLDSGYHPVLSFRENVNNALHFEAVAKQSEWQHRVMRCQAKSIAKNLWKAERDAVSAASGGQNSSASRKGNESVPTKRRYIKKKDRINNEDRSVISAGPTSFTTVKTDAAMAHAASVSSVNEAGNGTASLSTTSTTALVANKVPVKSTRNQSCLLGRDKMLKDPPATQTHKSSNSAIFSTAALSSTLIHQTSDCPPTSYDQYNLNQTPSSLISNNHTNKSNKNRKNSSASVAAYSHQYNHYHHNNNNSNNFFNGESNYYTIGHDWPAGGIDGIIAARSRTSSPTYSITSSNYLKYERSLSKNRSSYDIDNIVIPYSISAATRVEILPYKEIPTPKWRFVEVDTEENAKKLNPSDVIEGIINLSTANGHIKENELLKETKNPKNTGIDCEANEEPSNSGCDNQKECLNQTERDSNTTTSLICERDESEIKVENGIIEKYETNHMTPTRNDDIIEPDSKKCKMEQDVIKSPTNEQFFDESDNAECAEEDIADEAMIMRHERALAEERRKFQTYLKFPWSTRSRANRRIDSRAESSGANTPDPSSPASHTPCIGGGDQESILSPSNPSTPITPLDTISEADDISSSFLGVGLTTSVYPSSKQRQERRRTTSTKREPERRSPTPDLKELIPPYEPLKFPLSDDKFEELMRLMPLDHCTESTRFDDCFLPGGGITLKNMRSAYASGGGCTSKRTSRSSTQCSGDRRFKGSHKNISTDQNLENGSDFLYEEDYDDYPRHHLAPNDDHLTADDCTHPGGCQKDGNDDVYYDSYDVCSRAQKHRQNNESDEESTETEPFQDDDPNDPEWRGESEDRSRKKV